MGDRSLAHIEKVLTTYPIDGADNIEFAQVLDFHVVVKKGDCKTGDLVVYIEIDSILPDGLPAEQSQDLKEKSRLKKLATGDDIQKLENEIKEIVSHNTRPEFEFLRGKQFKIKAMKYGKFGIVSMGIIFPLSILPNDMAPKEGLDVTEALGITRIIDLDEIEQEPVKHSAVHRYLMKYKLYRSLYKIIKPKKVGNWPGFFPSKSDEENVQKCFSHIVNKYGREGYYLSEKMEGQNISVFLKKNKWPRKDLFGVCSRTSIKKDECGFTITARRLDLEKKLRKINKSILVRGEHCGGKIQGNIYKFPETKIFVFEVYDFNEKRLYTYDELVEFCRTNQLDMVPILDNDFILPETVQEILKISDGKSVYCDGKRLSDNDKGGILREGVVIRKKDNPSISFKARSPQESN